MFPIGKRPENAMFFMKTACPCAHLRLAFRIRTGDVFGKQG